MGTKYSGHGIEKIVFRLFSGIDSGFKRAFSERIYDYKLRFFPADISISPQLRLAQEILELLSISADYHKIPIGGLQKNLWKNVARNSVMKFLMTYASMRFSLSIG